MNLSADNRLLALIHHYNTNVKAFSEMCGYDRPQAFYDLIKGKTHSISATMCDNISAAFPEISKFWLMTGSGPMLEAERVASEPATPEYKQEPAAPAPVAPAEEPAAKVIPLVDTPALAGPLHAYLAEGCDLRGCKRIVTGFPSAEIAIPVSGDSMEPDFPNGSVVLLSKINEAAFIPWGHILVISTENGVFIKRIMPDDSDDSFICAESINPRYPKMRIPKSSVYDMYRVVAMQRIISTM